MIDDATIKKLFSELEKSGNIALACAKAGVGRTTYYRWGKENQELRKKLRSLMRIGKEQRNDIVDNTLFDIAVRDRSVPAVMNYLKHNHPRYKKKNLPNTVILRHERGINPIELMQEGERARIEEETSLLKKLIDEVRTTMEQKKG